MENDVICLAECIKPDYKTIYKSWKDRNTILGYNIELHFSFDEYCDKLKNDSNWNNWQAVIMRLEDNAVMGRIGLSGELPDLSITIFPAYVNQGYGSMAFSLGVKYCFEVLKLESVYAGCYEDNISSRKMIEKCGFKRNPDGDVIESHVFTGENRLQLDFVIIGLRVVGEHSSPLRVWKL